MPQAAADEGGAEQGVTQPQSGVTPPQSGGAEQGATPPQPGVTPAQPGVSPPQPGAGRGSTAPPAWLRNAAVWVGVAIALVVLVVLGVALLPGWWASLVGGWVQGVEDRGVVLGLAIGAGFTLLPLAVGTLALRSGLGSRVRIGLVVAALLLLLPNVLTLAVALGRTDARSVIAIEAPSFRGATAVGVATAVLLLVALLVVRWWSRRTRRQVTEARERATQVSREAVAAAEHAQPAAPRTGPDGATQHSDPGADQPRTVVEPVRTVVDPDRPAAVPTTSPLEPGPPTEPR